MRREAMHAAELSDADLVAESLSGDRDAFAQIVERYQTLVASLAYSATGNISQSEDLAQETFVTAWKELAELRDPAKLRPWLCSITRFLIGKEFRRQGREPVHEAESLDTLEEWTSPEPLPPDHAMSQEELSLLWRSLERIPSAYREPLVLFYREHQSIEAVAKGLGLSEDAVKQRLSRGRRLLQEQFLAFVAGALHQTRPGKAFALGVLAALPLLATTAKGATVGTALAKHGSVAAKATGSGGVVQAIAQLFMGMVGWVAGALSLGGYIGYKMGGDRQNSERSRRSVATFWRIMGISMSLLFGLPWLLVALPEKWAHLVGTQGQTIWTCYFNTCPPLLVFVVVPLLLVIWIWQRRRRAIPGDIPGGAAWGHAPKAGTIWVTLAMAAAICHLGFMYWAYGRIPTSHFPKRRFLSTSEVQGFIADQQARKFRFRLYQSANGARTLSGDLLLENGKVSPFIAPAEAGTMALLTEKGVGYETTIEKRDSARLRTTPVGWWAFRLQQPFSLFILVAGPVTLLRGRHSKPSGPHQVTDLKAERRVDKAFAAFAACALVALAVFRGATTDWTVRTLLAYQVPDIVAQHKHARFEVFEYWDGSRKLWISDLHNPDFIAPASEFTLGVLTSQGIPYQTYVAGMAGLPKPGRAVSVAWIAALAVGAGGLLLWVAKRRSVTPASV